MGLTEDMIDNDFDRPSSSPIPILKSTHLKDKNGLSLQQQCCVCKIKCTKVCSICAVEADDRDVYPHYFCDNLTGRACFEQHCYDHHSTSLCPKL